MAAVAQGTSCVYGVAGTATDLFVQSYSVASSFNSEAMVQNGAGLTQTMRFDDRKSEVTVEGVVKTTSATPPALGTTLTFTVAAKGAYPSGGASNTFVGTITKVEEKGSNKEFVNYSITAISFEGFVPA
jgi:hypothetical protein